MSHLSEMSNITTRANNQFPRPDFHRLDKQPYRLQPLDKGTPHSLRQGVSRMRRPPVVPLRKGDKKGAQTLGLAQLRLSPG